MLGRWCHRSPLGLTCTAQSGLEAEGGRTRVNSLLQARGGRQCYTVVVVLRLVKCSEGREGGGSGAGEEVGVGHQG